MLEEDASHEDLVWIVKEDDVRSEQTLQVLVQLTSGSGQSRALRGTHGRCNY